MYIGIAEQDQEIAALRKLVQARVALLFKHFSPLGVFYGTSLAVVSPGCICLITLAGFPATTVHDGTSFVTTAPAPTTAQSPTVTPPT